MDRRSVVNQPNLNQPNLNQPCLKLTTYFGERQRTVGDGGRPRFLADALLDLFATREIATSVMLRGIASFGPRHVLRTDESLSLSEDPPVAVAAIDVESKISGLVDDVVAMTGRGLVTMERARWVGGGNAEIGTDDSVKLTVYTGRRERIGGLPAHRAACDLLHRQGFSGGAVFLGVDGTAHGERHRAAFFGRNVNVPLMIVAVGTATQTSAAVAELSALAPRALLTVERVRLCKRDGELFDRPHKLPDADEQGRPLWQKLMVHTSEATTHGGVPIHRALVHRLLESGTARGATALRGIWGFHGDHKPHGDKVFQLTRRMPVVTVIVDTPERIARSFDIVDELTADHGLVTSEMVPAVVSIDGADRDGEGPLARHDY
jgi:PII-like signaling protein